MTWVILRLLPYKMEKRDRITVEEKKVEKQKIDENEGKVYGCGETDEIKVYPFPGLQEQQALYPLHQLPNSKVPIQTIQDKRCLRLNQFTVCIHELNIYI